MSQRKKKATLQRREEEVQAVIANWSELCPDLLRYVFKRLTFTDLNRAKSVCSSWYSASRGCSPKPNQIPWLILFPSKEECSSNNNSSNCVLFVPEDRDNVYKTGDLGVLDSVQSLCLATYGSWLLMMDRLNDNLYVLNPLTCERIVLPYNKFFTLKPPLYNTHASFWIDNRTKDYLVVFKSPGCTLFTKKGLNTWHDFPPLEWYAKFVYNHKNQKLYIYFYHGPVKVWDFSGDKLRRDGILEFNHYDFPDRKIVLDWNPHIAVTVSGDVLHVTCLKMRQSSKPWDFCIYKTSHEKRKFVKINSLGDEALILDMGVTVVAKEIPGIKRNSIYFSGLYHGRDDPKDIFIFDLTTQKIESLPQCVFSSIQFSHARWFFPDYSG